MSADEVEDVVAETFLTAWRRMAEVPEDAVPWLFAAARGHIANRHRGARRRRALLERLWWRRPSDAWSTRDDGPDVDDRVVRAIRRLPPKEREALLLVAWDGLDPQRAARAARCGVGTFRVRLHRAGSRLRRELAAAGPDLAARSLMTQMEDV